MLSTVVLRESDGWMIMRAQSSEFKVFGPECTYHYLFTADPRDELEEYANLLHIPTCLNRPHSHH